MRLLVTRPQPDAERTAAVLHGRGHEVALAPLLAFAATAAALPRGPWAGVLLTSLNAVRAIHDDPAAAPLRSLPVLTVGDRTAEAARAAGFADVQSASGDARDLVRLAARRFMGGRLLYLCGEHRAADLAAALADAGIVVATVAVYRMNAAERFPPAVAESLAGRRIDGVLHYSRRTAEAYLACAQAGGILAPALAPIHYALSAAVAAPLRAAGAAHVSVAATPDEAALLRALEGR
ncbi:MAG: uroporphyrinogen-III synthase [Variibacter sp.]